MNYDVIIVGAGMAGLTAGIYVARAGKTVLMLESGAVGGQIVTAFRIDNWPGNYGVSGGDLMKNISEQAIELGVEVRYEETVNILQNDSGFTVSTDENEYKCKALIIATGTIPRKLSAKQEKDAGKRPISYCATCDGALYKDKPVVVVGSGNTAKLEMEYLEGICKRVYHIHHDDPIPEDAEAVFVAIGRVPATGFLGGLVKLDKDGYVVAGEDCTTSCPGVMVAGDVRTKSVRQLVTAAGDAAVAADAAVKYLGKIDG
ncbi:FAD-dependent oxidoreductase [Candidatus Saccharibacteria bacterium]|nr:FAD-dependent oxidoreductase [Candidatus Saccharibacteria bacterium]